MSTVPAEDDFSDLDGIPRKGTPLNEVDGLAAHINGLSRRIDRLERTATLRNASIGGGDGLRILDEDGKTRAWLRGTNGAIIIQDSGGGEVVRLGPLEATAPGEFGVEAKGSDGQWVRLGSQTTTWANVAGKPSAYPTGPHGHQGSEITGPVASASTAGYAATAGQANLADGSEYGFNNTVAGTQSYALWVGNDGGFHLGRNTSSRRYKENIRSAAVSPEAVLQLRPVVFDRKDQDLEFKRVPGKKNEFGLIAEEVADVLPELVTRFEGRIDGVSYDLIPVAMIPLLKRQQERIIALEQQVHKLTADRQPPPTG